MKITAEKLQEIIESHGKWLRNKEGGQRADLRDADLRDADLQRATLQRANLQCADLRDADLQRATLRDADLQRATLQGAYLQDADLQRADLQRADLQRANLQRANLQRANLQRADLQGADLRDADLQGANLQGADLPDGIYQVVGCGSANRCTTYDSINDRVICGCWNDDNGNHLAAFEERIEAVYGAEGSDPNQQYYNEYMSAIAFFKAISKS